jgi:hypothetical protein
MLLRQHDGWRPVYDALDLDWIDRGTGDESAYGVRPTAAVALTDGWLALRTNTSISGSPPLHVVPIEMRWPGSVVSLPVRDFGAWLRIREQLR